MGRGGLAHGFARATNCFALSDAPDKSRMIGCRRGGVANSIRIAWFVQSSRTTQWAEEDDNILCIYRIGKY